MPTVEPTVGLALSRHSSRFLLSVMTSGFFGPAEELTWQASHALASKQSYLGIQDATWKAHPCSQMTGAWAGVIVHILDNLVVCVLTSQEKWRIMKGILSKWKTALDASSQF